MTNLMKFFFDGISYVSSHIEWLYHASDRRFLVERRLSSIR